MKPPNIADTLKLFNRKERHLLIQNCLGEAAVALSPEFCSDVAATLGTRLSSSIQQDAWWATDYHLDWLAGALTWYPEGGEDVHKPRCNKPCLIKGNQEDIDLIIASGNDIILVEAKGHSSWSNSQLTSKIERLKQLCDDAGIVKSEISSFHFKIHLVLASVNHPAKVDCGEWPSWSKKDNLPYSMSLKASATHIYVGRCDSSGRPDVNGGRWRMSPHRGSQ
jgi:hypothetical protein